MMGDKIKLLLRGMPSTSYTLEVYPNGVVAVRYFDNQTKMRGRFEFSEDSDMEFIYTVLNSLGFKEEDNGK